MIVNKFSERHIGPRDSDTEKMLKMVSPFIKSSCHNHPHID